MPRLTRIYTRTGDDGTTALASGERTSKSSLRIEAYGTVDELSSAIGCALAGGVAVRLVEPLQGIQNQLFHLGAELATPQAPAAGPHIEDRHVEALERLLDELLEDLAPLTNFILPGGTATAAQLHLARTVCRRAERRLVALAAAESVRSEPIRYLNRLSDLLFVMARCENRWANKADVLWDSRG
jgi:cob(I)alamin adenosyltransferase